jgi:hypothetical protein
MALMALTRREAVIINHKSKPLIMAENSRGQNRNGQRNRNDSPSKNNQTRSNGRRDSSSSGIRDTNLDRVRNDNRSPKGSGLSEKRFTTGSDYDGQLSDE